MLITLGAHRVTALLLTHFVSLRSYGCGNGSYALNSKQSLEYVILSYVMQDNDGVFSDIDSNLTNVVICGNLLLKIPFAGGESMFAGQSSLKRIADKLAFAEQILAYGSPTMVILPEMAFGHLAFFRTMVEIDDTLLLWMQDRNKCKQYIFDFVNGTLPFSTHGILAHN